MEPKKDLTATSAPPYSSATGGGRNWLGGWSGLALCALAVGGAILLFGGSLSGAQTAGSWLPLLFVLPCAIMMFMCMRGMGGNRSDTGQGHGSDEHR